MRKFICKTFSCPMWEGLLVGEGLSTLMRSLLWGFLTDDGRLWPLISKQSYNARITQIRFKRLNRYSSGQSGKKGGLYFGSRKWQVCEEVPITPTEAGALLATGGTGLRAHSKLKFGS